MNAPSPRPTPEKLLRLPEVEYLTGIKKTLIYSGMQASPPTFPRCLRLTARAVAWRESDITNWIDQRQEVSLTTESVKGTAAQWRKRTGKLCAGNSRLVFAVASAFAGPLLRCADEPTFGVHFYGDSAIGKTTALKVAASVYGGPSYVQSWRATDNALEAMAAQHSGGLLTLDELEQVDPQTSNCFTDMLIGELGKARVSPTGTPRPRQSWRLLFLSAGVPGLADHVAEGMKRTRTGQRVRMADIPADAGKGLGVFETTHKYQSGAAFSNHLRSEADSVYGATGRAWLQWLTESAGTIKADIRRDAAALCATLVPKDASGQVERVGARFALVGAAGEMATAAGLSGWAKGESEWAARECFNAWLAAAESARGLK